MLVKINHVHTAACQQQAEKKLYKTISYSSLKLADRSISDMDMKTAGTVRILKLFENEYINVEFTVMFIGREISIAGK